MPLGKSKEAKVTAEYKLHEAKIMREASERYRNEKRKVYVALVTDILSQVEIDYSDAEDFLDVECLMNKYDIKLK